MALFHFGISLVLMLISGIVCWRMGRYVGAEDAIKQLNEKEKKLGPLNLIEGFELPEPDDPRWEPWHAGKCYGYKLGYLHVYSESNDSNFKIQLDFGDGSSTNIAFDGSPKKRPYYFAVRKAVGQRYIQASLDKKQLTEI